MAVAGKLAGKISIVTGAASGIGLAVCKRFAKEGSKLVMVDLNKDELEKVYPSINTSSDQVVWKHGDVSEPGFAESITQLAINSFGKPSNVLINSAGIGIRKSVIAMTDKEFDDVIKVNVHGTFLFTRAFLRQFNVDHSDMNSQKQHIASIVNLSSLSGKTGMQFLSSYATSKSGVIGFTKSVSTEFGKFGIRCNAVLPGFTETPMVAPIADIINQLIPLIPLGRMGRPDEIANACLFLASNESSYVNGASLEVTGGLFA